MCAKSDHSYQCGKKAPFIHYTTVMCKIITAPDTLNVLKLISMLARRVCLVTSFAIIRFHSDSLKGFCDEKVSVNTCILPEFLSDCVGCDQKGFSVLRDSCNLCYYICFKTRDIYCKTVFILTL